MQSPSDAHNAIATMRSFAVPRMMQYLMHVGEYKWSCRTADFENWLICDGRELSRETYAVLFSLLGTSFGAPTPTTFRLPDARGRVPGAVGAGTGLTARTLGVTGAEAHTLSTAELPSHSHSGTTSSDGVHTHGVNDPGHAHTQWTINDDQNLSGGNPPGFGADSAGYKTWSNINPATTGISIQSGGAHTHTFTTSAIGSNDSFSLMQPTVYLGNVFVFGGYT